MRWAQRGVSYRSNSNPARLVIVHCLNPLPTPPAAKRILIVRLGAMGDVVRTLPSLRALRIAYPEAEISWLVERAAAGVLVGLEELDEVMLFPREALSSRLRRGKLLDLGFVLRDFVSQLRRKDFDLVVDFHSILKSGLISYLSGAPCRVTYAPPYGREWGWRFATHRAQLEPPHSSRYERNAGLIAFLGLDESGSQTLPPEHLLTVEEKSGARMDVSLGHCSPQVLIHPGSSGHTAYKRYKPEGYAALARMLKRRDGSSTLVCRGTSPEELALAEQIVADSNGAASLAPATPKLSDLIALIDRAQLFVGTDSGPLHLAATLGTPVVQIVGPTDPLENRPWSATPSRQVRIPVACSPCRTGCPDATCMKIIPHELLYQAVRELQESLQSRAPRRTPSTRPETHATASPACP